MYIFCFLDIENTHLNGYFERKLKTDVQLAPFEIFLQMSLNDSTQLITS